MCPAAKFLFYGISEDMSVALYMMRQLTADITGLRDGLEEYRVWYGPKGSNLKGAHPSLHRRRPSQR